MESSQSAIVTLRPQVPIMDGVDQLHVDQHAIADPAHAAFENVPHA